jgi:hypothetical protein
MIKAKVTWSGDWAKADKLAAAFPAVMKNSIRFSLLGLGKKMRSIVIGHLKNQDLPWRRLKKKYKMKKLIDGFDTRIWMRTKTVRNAIITQYKKNSVTVTVDKVPMPITNGGKKISALKVAKINEYGSAARNIPARPLFAPSIKEALAWHAKNNLPEMIFMKAIKKYL